MSKSVISKIKVCMLHIFALTYIHTYIHAYIHAYIPVCCAVCIWVHIQMFPASPWWQRMASSTAIWHKVPCITISLMSFAAITLCVASQQLFIFVHLEYNLQFSNGWYEGTTHLHEVLLQTWETCIVNTWKITTVFSDNSSGRTQTFEWFSQFKHSEALVEDCKHSGHLSTGCTDANVEILGRIVSED